MLHSYRTPFRHFVNRLQLPRCKTQRETDRKTGLPGTWRRIASLPEE